MSLTCEFDGPSEAGGEPPDPTLAAGPDELVVMVNNEISIYGKSGALVSKRPFVDFFPDEIEGHRPFDPWATYDRYSDRFIVMAVEAEREIGGRESFLHIAISTDSSPDDFDTDWYFYSIASTYDFDPSPEGELLAWPDYPKMAADEDNIYITGRYEKFGGVPVYPGVVITRLDKGPMLEGTPSTPEQILVPTVPPPDDPDRGAVLQPILGVGRAAEEPQLFVERRDTGIRIWELDGQNNLSNTTIPAANARYYEGGPGEVPLNTFSPFMMNAVWRDDSLWTTHTVDVDGDATVRWYEIDTTNQVYSLVQTGDIDPGPGIHTFMPGITVNARGDMGITYTQTSDTQYPTMKFPTDPAWGDYVGFGTREPLVLAA